MFGFSIGLILCLEIMPTNNANSPLCHMRLNSTKLLIAEKIFSEG